MENDNIVVQKRELEDIINNLERRKDTLYKENERIKAELKFYQGNEQPKTPGQKLAISLGNGLYGDRKSSKTNTQQMMGLKGIQNGF